MSQRGISNLSASVRQRLLNWSRQQGEDFDLVLSRYANERLLYRLAQSPYARKFILKGAMLFALWTGAPHRPTRDLDLLGYGDPASSRLERIFRELCVVACEPDGLVFEPDSVHIASIREGQEYDGLRVTLLSKLERARIAIQIDVGFGDAVVPQAIMVTYPTLLNFPAPRLRAYSRESVIAEKMHAMVMLGMLNSRMKDFYDVWTLLHTFTFDGAWLQNAIVATFERRHTAIPSTTPVALSAQFASDASKTTQWTAFLRRNKLQTGNTTFPQIISEMNNFLVPVLEATQRDGPFTQLWQPGGPWTATPTTKQ